MKTNAGPGVAVTGSKVAWRVYVIMTALTGAGLPAAWYFLGVPGALGFLAGAAMSFANAWWIHRIALSIGSEGEKPRGAFVLAIFRYFLMLGVLYGILSLSEPGFFAALAGCFVHIGAVVLEVVYELTYGTP